MMIYIPSEEALVEEPKAAKQVADNTQIVTDVESCSLLGGVGTSCTLGEGHNGMKWVWL